MTAGKRDLRVTPKEKSVLATIYKAVVAATQLAAQAIAFGLLHGTALRVTSLVIAAIGVIGVYKIPNAPKEVVAGTQELEGRLADLENVVPDLPGLIDAIGDVVQSGITKVLTTVPPPQVIVADPAIAPAPVTTPPPILNQVVDPPTAATKPTPHHRRSASEEQR